MKFCLTLAALIALCSVGQCQLKPIEMPFVSLTTFRGYVYSSGRWQPHICRTLSSAPTQRVLQTSPTGAPRELGHTVRCHHGMMFVPGDPSRRVMTTPNRSSRFVARAAHRTLVITVEIDIDGFDLGGVLPGPPYRGGPTNPVIMRPPGNDSDDELVLILVEETRLLRFAPYRLPPPPLFPRLQ